MPDDPPDDIFSAWQRAQAADPNTRRNGVPFSASPAASQVPPAASGAPPAATPPPQPQPSPAPSQADGSGVAKTADSLVGRNAMSISPFLRSTGQTLDPTRANWCAAFVNGVLAANGEQGATGPGKNVATSFLSWGQPVQGDPQRGDVLVQPRGHPMGGIGGHVGIAAGPVAQGSSGTYYLMQSGNYAGHVAYSWEPAQSVVVRRAPQSSDDQTPPAQGPQY